MDKDYSDEKWNMAMAYHMRIDNLLTACTMAQMQNDGLGWYKGLYRLYIEIQAKMKPIERENALALVNNLTQWKTDAMKKQKTIPTSMFVEVELYLRQILEDRHMLTPKSEDLKGL